MTVSPLTVPQLSQTIQFLRRHEMYCVSLVSHLVSNGMPCLPPPDFHYYVFFSEPSLFSRGEIVAVLAFSDGGLVLHAIDGGANKIALAPYIESILAEFSLFCILGEKSGTDFIASIAASIGFRMSSEIDYTLMHYEASAAKTLPYLNSSIAFVRCSIRDANALFPLQQGYDIEERIPPGMRFYPAACMRGLEHDLQENIVVALKQRDSFLATARYNAQGLGWVQIGGVYTMPAERRKGYAQFLVQRLALAAEEVGMGTVLFVKNNNRYAQKAYVSAGFVADAPFKICYFQ